MHIFLFNFFYVLQANNVPSVKQEYQALQIYYFLLIYLGMMLFYVLILLFQS